MEIAGFEDVEAKIDLIISDSRLAAYLELSLMRASFAAIKSARSRSQPFSVFINYTMLHHYILRFSLSSVCWQELTTNRNASLLSTSWRRTSALLS